MTDTTPVVAVKLRYSARAYWFDPVLGEYAVGDLVLVDTERGREVGRVSATDIAASPAQIEALSVPLKPIIRLLDEQDRTQQERMIEKSAIALPLFRELIEKSGLEMKAVAVEYLFTGDKAVFYFASESRVDFRELVREMAAQLHIRVELRQIGVRDEARMLGGIAHCGEKLCCARMGGDFQPVSIRMAKEQDLPLNPEKISGACGRLMCCLRYEFETYKEFKNRAPKRGTEITTPLGIALVTDYDTPRETISMQLEDGKTLAIALKDFDQQVGENGEHRRLNSLGREALERSANNTTLLALSTLDRDGLVDELVPGEGGGSVAGSVAPDTRRQRRAGQAGSAAENQDSNNRSGANRRRATGNGRTAADGDDSSDEREAGSGREAADGRGAGSRRESGSRRAASSGRNNGRERSNQRDPQELSGENGQSGSRSAGRADSSREIPQRTRRQSNQSASAERQLRRPRQRSQAIPGNPAGSESSEQTYNPAASNSSLAAGSDIPRFSSDPGTANGQDGRRRRLRREE